MPAIAGLLLDIDGVLTVSWQPLPGAVEAFAELRALGLPLRLLTNTTSRTRKSIAATLSELGFAVTAAEILTAPAATAAYLRQTLPGAQCHLLCSGDIAADLDGVTLTKTGEAADVVIIGGAGPKFSFERCNEAFNLLLRGAQLVAMHRNLLWRTADGMSLDAGAYITGLEQAAGIEAVVVGKPSRAFYGAALSELGTGAAQTVMVGDDLKADIGGAQEAGIAALLVRTGKFLQAEFDRSEVRPDAVLDSIADVASWIRTR